MDFYQLCDTLSVEDLLILGKVYKFMQYTVAPIINKHWMADTFPFEILPYFKELDIIGKSQLLTGLITMEMGRVDPSIATFYTIQNGLVIGTIEKMGTEEQKKKWLPSLKNFEKIGCFALTEPDVGSGILGMETTAEEYTIGWILNGQKKWVGNATWCDISIVWARDVLDGQIKGFIVENSTQGFSVEKIEDKFGLKICQNGLITL